MKNSSGFTLAEILITLGIIGIISAITLPNLIENYQKKSVANRLKKMYAVTKQAVKLSTVDNDEVLGWDWDLAENDIYNFTKTYFYPYFKGSQIYNGKDFSKITNYKYSIKNLSNGIITNLNVNYFAIIILPDGSYFITQAKHDTGFGWLFIDINGLSGPNRIARDIFVLNMTPHYYYNKKRNAEIIFWNEGLSREILTNPGPQEDKLYFSGSYGCSKNNKYGYYSGYSCGALIQADGWKISEDYPW